MVSKKQKEKRKDFQKTKLKVGKSAKPASQTNTSFVAKAIHVPSQLSSFSYDKDLEKFYSLCRHHSSATRKEALVNIQTLCSTRSIRVTSALVTAISPLIVDLSKSVRDTVLELLKSLDASELSSHISHMMLYVHSAMTHLDSDVRGQSTEFLSFMLDINSDEVCRLAFSKTLSCFFPLLGWDVDTGDQTHNRLAATAATVSFAKGKAQLAHIQCLDKFLRAGLNSDSGDNGSIFHPDSSKHLISAIPNPYVSLHLFGEQGESSTEHVDQRIELVTAFSNTLDRGLNETTKQGGQVGRLAGNVIRFIHDSINA
uniref:Pre-rRNA-processing protein n=1 Tax=Blastobotrys adeninivorans TaxID=409370 RepID=A0A060TGP2_BLAAD